MSVSDISDTEIEEFFSFENLPIVYNKSKIWCKIFTKILIYFLGIVLRLYPFFTSST